MNEYNRGIDEDIFNEPEIQTGEVESTKATILATVALVFVFALLVAFLVALN
jgi:hypothetical protein